MKVDRASRKSLNEVRVIPTKAISVSTNGRQQGLLQHEAFLCWEEALAYPHSGRMQHGQKNNEKTSNISKMQMLQPIGHVGPSLEGERKR